MKPPLDQLEAEQIYFQAADRLVDIEAGAPITLWADGHDTIHVSDWSNPKAIRFEAVRLHGAKTTFEAGEISLVAYYESSRGRFEQLYIRLSIYKP